MALRLQLDVVRAGELSWNRSSVIVPAEFLSAVRSLAAGSVVEAKCEWQAGGLMLLTLPRVVATAESWQARLDIAVDRGNWESVLELLAAQPENPLTAAWKTRAFLGLGKKREFEEAFAQLIASEHVDLSDTPTGLWRIRLDIKPDHWLELPRKLRAGAFKLAWRGLLSAKQFSEQRFADTLLRELSMLLEEVDPSSRPPVVHAGGPQLQTSLETDDIVAWCGAHLGPFATPAERAEFGPLIELFATYDRKERDPIYAWRGRRPGSEPTVGNALIETMRALTNMQPRPALQRALDRFGIILARSPRALTMEFLSGLDQFGLVNEARTLCSDESLRDRITSVSYRGSVELRIAELDAIVGRAGESWFALRRHEREWITTEGTREDALAAIPDELFEEAVGIMLGHEGRSE